MKKESLLKELPVSEMVATLERLGQFGVRARHLKSLRSDDSFAEKIAGLLRSGGYEECSLSQQRAREIMGTRMIGLKDLPRLGVMVSRDVRDKMTVVPFSVELLEKHATSHILIADPDLSFSEFMWICKQSEDGIVDQKEFDSLMLGITDRNNGMHWRLVMLTFDATEPSRWKWQMTEIAPDLETTVK